MPGVPGGAYNRAGIYFPVRRVQDATTFGADEHYVISYEGFIDTIEERRILVKVKRSNEDGEPLPGAMEIQKWVRPQEKAVAHGTEVELGE